MSMKIFKKISGIKFLKFSNFRKKPLCAVFLCILISFSFFSLKSVFSDEAKAKQWSKENGVNAKYEYPEFIDNWPRFLKEQFARRVIRSLYVVNDNLNTLPYYNAFKYVENIGINRAPVKSVRQVI